MRRTLSYILAASIAASSTAVTAGTAAAMPKLSTPSTVEAGLQVEQVDRKRWKKHRRGSKRHYSKRRHRDYGRRHYYRKRDRDFDGLPFVAGIAGLAIGAAIANSSRPYYPQDDYNSYCARKYRSWDPYSRTYLGYDGKRHACRIP